MLPTNIKDLILDFGAHFMNQRKMAKVNAEFHWNVVQFLIWKDDGDYEIFRHHPLRNFSTIADYPQHSFLRHCRWETVKALNELNYHYKKRRQHWEYEIERVWSICDHVNEDGDELEYKEYVLEELARYHGDFDLYEFCTPYERRCSCLEPLDSSSECSEPEAKIQC